MDRPLAGLRVVELARVLAGPWAGQTLADLGADVIKVESPGGDDTRGWGPPFVDRDGAAAYFHATNRGKRSVALDLKSETGRDVALALMREADVVIENFRTGSLERLGLGYDTVRETNPRLVWCSISGFGRTGPYADRPGYDYVLQGMSGLMSVTGAPDGAPMRAGVPVVDLFTGLYAVIAVQAALAQRERTGEGQMIDLALMDAGVAMMSNQALNFLASGAVPERLGNQHPNLVPYQVFPASDGWVIVAVGNDTQFRRFAVALGAPEIGDAEAYATNADRIARRGELTAKLEELTRKMGRDALLSACDAAGVPAGPINDLADVFADPQVIHRGMQIAPGGVPGVKSPMAFSGADLALDRPSPGHDEHGAAICEAVAGGVSPWKGGQETTPWETG